ncbi:hypothetical protein ACFVXH_21460 [Kitasatospora sp. NPDC058184]|uniref:hypothetical protein n=1 Tax=Kitasatospora sp. NPDC058184 TaxID=3346370 RepID=UPI0036DB9E43
MMAPSETDRRLRSRTADRVEVTQVLSQDVVLGGPVIVDTARRKPVLAFHNPGEKAGSDSDGHQALVFSPRSGPVPDIRHVARALGTPTGWRVTSPFEDWLQEQAKQPGWVFRDLTVTVTPGNGSRRVVAEFLFGSTDPQDLVSQVFTVELSQDGTQWAEPVPLDTTGLPQRNYETVDTTYTTQGDPVTYAVPTGASGLWIRSKDQGDAYLPTSTPGPNGVPVAAALSGSEVVLASVDSGTVIASRATLSTTFSVQTDPLPFQAKQVVTGFATGEGATFLVSDSADGLWTVLYEGDTLKPGQKLHDKGTVRVDSHPTADGGRAVYVVDTDHVCWIHRLPAQGAALPGIPLQKDVVAVATPPSPLETSTVFLVEAGTEPGDETKNELRLDVQDSATGLWRRVHVHDPAAGVKEVKRYRLEATLLDQFGAPMPGQHVTLARAPGNTSGEVAFDGQVTDITDQPTPLKTDLFGRITLTFTPTGLSAPDLILKVPGIDDIALRPSRDTEDYLRGTKNKKLNLTNPAGPLPDFGSGALAGAKVPGQAGHPTHDSLAPWAAKSKLIAVPAAKAITAMAGYKADPMSQDVRSFRLSVQEGNGAPELVYEEPNEPEVPDDSWEGSPIAFGDLHAGLHSGAITPVSITFDTKNGILAVIARIGTELKTFWTSAKKAIEAVWGFIGSIFNVIGSKLLNVVDWLAAWFDFPAIWRTKKVFEDSVLHMLDKTEAAVAEVGKLADGYLKEQKDSVRKTFDGARAKLGDTTVGSFDTWSGKGKQDVPVIGDAKLADLGGGNAHLNWFQDKAAGMSVASQAGDKEIVDDDAWNACAPTLKQAGGEFVNGVSDLLEGFTKLAANPQDLKASTLAKLLESFEQLALAALDFGDVLVHAMVDLVSKAVGKLKTALTAERDAGILGKLWKWIAKQAGDPDAPLTVNGAVCLLGALPVTLVYRLIKGKGAEPFPEKSTPLKALRHGSAPRDTLTPTDKTWLLVAAILQTMQFAFYAAGDLLAYESAQGLDWPYLGPLVQVANLLFTLVVFDIATTVLKTTPAPGWAIALVATLFALAFAVLAVVYRTAFKGWLSKLADAGDPIPVLLMLKGCFWNLRGAVARIVDGTTEDADEGAAQVLLAISPATALLNNRIMLKEPDSGFVIATVKAGLDTFFTVLGGVLLCRHYDKH